MSERLLPADLVKDLPGVGRLYRFLHLLTCLKNFLNHEPLLCIPAKRVASSTVAARATNLSYHTDYSLAPLAGTTNRYFGIRW
jgi:hypothetical protein